MSGCAAPGSQRVAVLLVEDDEDDVLITRGLLRSTEGTQFQIDWARTLDEVTAHLDRGAHDAYLVDYRLAAHTGLDVARAILARERHSPVIMLTGRADRDVDVRATELGVADFLVKSRIDGATLERSIRYAITHQRTLRALADSEERFALAMAGANDGLWDWDLRADQLYLSARWKAMLGYTDSEIGPSPAEWLDRIHASDLDRFQQALAGHLNGNVAHFEVEHRVRARDRSYRWMLARGLAVGDSDGRPTRIAGSQTDITERKRAESQLQHDALHDGLTGLPNRVLFLDRLHHAMRRGSRTQGQERTAVLFLDIDRFKLVNDSLGHLAGDRLLVEVARRLERGLRPGDTVARLGGDEFIVLLEELHGRAEAEQIASRMLHTLTEPFPIDDRDLYLSASIGIAMAGGESPGAVIRDADAAMYRAKAEGKGRHAMFDARLHEAAVARLDVETRLRRGLGGPGKPTGVVVLYQPIVHGDGLRLAGFEALARWRDDAGELLPDRFIPIAEETGLIHPLGRIVLREACRQLTIWRRRAPAPLTMSVNLSGRQLLDAAFADEVEAALADHRLRPEALRLEITESEAAADPAAVCAALEMLHRRIGVRARLDDFGTGASSLTFLRGFPGDALKIDRSFVAAMATDEDAYQIVTAIVGLAHNLGIEVVAEGVETDDQLTLLRGLGCEFVQGFLIGHPLEAGAAERRLEPGLATIA
ncbi:MAG: putative bifunctional diguanylate cyclase/phosphodiesterase [Solirubrobacteraceae bacterium]